MTVSSFSWLSYDDTERQRALEVVESLKSPGTIDDLGIGPIRDTIARALFPGVSVLHSRARYFTLVPALVGEAVASATPQSARTRLDRLEGDLIHALLAGDPEAPGIIGRDAKRSLKTKPSAMFWQALKRYEIVTADHSIDQLLRTAVRARHGAATAPQEFGDDYDDARSVYGIAAEAAKGWLPTNWKKAGITLALEPDEAEYLRERIMTTTSGSLYSWFLTHRVPPGNAEFAWDHPAVDEFPAPMRELVDHGQRFSHLNYLAALGYNVLVSQAAGSEHLVEAYRAEFDQWDEELRSNGLIADWSIDEFLRVVVSYHPRLRANVSSFVRRWHALAVRPPSEARSKAIASLISDREYEAKRQRARLHNAKARDDWQGGAGLWLLGYNWGVAQRLMNDIFEAVPDATA